MPVRVIAPPGEEPVSLAEAKLHLRVDHDDENALITGLIVAARQLVEVRYQRALVSQTLELTADGFPPAGRPLRLPMAPIGAVTAVRYVDPAGTEQTWPADQYQVDTASSPGRVLPAPGRSWPSTRAQVGAVSVTYTAGYGGPADVPATITAAIKILTGALYANRDSGDALPPTVEALLAPYRVWGL